MYLIILTLLSLIGSATLKKKLHDYACDVTSIFLSALTKRRNKLKRSKASPHNASRQPTGKATYEVIKGGDKKA